VEVGVWSAADNRDEGAGYATIAAELQRRFGLRPRDAFRQAHGWTQDQVAARLNAVGGGAATFTGARISDYERWPVGGRRPTLPVLSALARLFGTDASSLVDMEDLEAVPDTDRAALAAPQTGPGARTMELAPVVSAARDLAGDLPLNRTAVLDETDLVIAVTERTQAFGAWSESSNVGPMTLEDVAASTRRIAPRLPHRAPADRSDCCRRDTSSQIRRRSCSPGPATSARSSPGWPATWGIPQQRSRRRVPRGPAWNRQGTARFALGCSPR